MVPCQFLEVRSERKSLHNMRKTWVGTTFGVIIMKNEFDILLRRAFCYMFPARLFFFIVVETKNKFQNVQIWKQCCECMEYMQIGENRSQKNMQKVKNCRFWSGMSFVQNKGTALFINMHVLSEFIFIAVSNC